ncbi:PIN domain-containing protein [Methylovulum miyakonense]|uniref:hypothetical protein n=1 Tax=Methylovulum miyakonense TaxID=645578 RepID=UPI0003790399|nr:hypothetical protein [Methylovulum miyakonense]
MALPARQLPSGRCLGYAIAINTADSPTIAAALQAECTMLYSEDMQHGQIIDNRMMAVNPFL